MTELFSQEKLEFYSKLKARKHFKYDGQDIENEGKALQKLMQMFPNVDRMILINAMNKAKENPIKSISKK